MGNYHASHPMVRTRLSRDQIGKLHELLKFYGLNLNDWLVAQIDRCLAERRPESQGDVKKVLPPDVVTLAQQVLHEEGDRVLRSANSLTDPVLRSERRREAARFLNASDWFADVIEQRRFRRHLLESGQARPRHRAIRPRAADQSSN